MKKTSSKSKSVDWKAIIELIGIFIKFLFQVQKKYRKQSQTAQDSKE